MTQLDHTATLDQTPTERLKNDGEGAAREADHSSVNVGEVERAVSIASGAILAAFGAHRRSVGGLLIAGIGGAMIYRGATGHCPAYSKFGINTAEQDPQTQREQLAVNGIRVEQAYLINRSPEDLYTFWRDFKNLPSIMTHLKRVDVIDDRNSHWVAEAPRIVGGQVEWDAEITRDEPNALIAWRSLPGSQVENAGQIRFAKAIGDRGTEVHVFMDYLPPAGKLGHWIATVFGDAPRRQMQEDLRSFKRLMECGEVVTTKGQPTGSCKGKGQQS